MEQRVLSRLRKDFLVGSEDWNHGGAIGKSLEPNVCRSCAIGGLHSGRRQGSSRILKLEVIKSGPQRGPPPEEVLSNARTSVTKLEAAMLLSNNPTRRAHRCKTP